LARINAAGDFDQEFSDGAIAVDHTERNFSGPGACLGVATVYGSNNTVIKGN
jgi:hypothetical protein